LLSENSPKLKKAARVKPMLTLQGVGFYSYIAAMVFGDTSESINEVISPRFLLSRLRLFGLNQTLTLQTISKQNDKDI